MRRALPRARRSSGRRAPAVPGRPAQAHAPPQPASGGHGTSMARGCADGQSAREPDVGRSSPTQRGSPTDTAGAMVGADHWPVSHHPFRSGGEPRDAPPPRGTTQALRMEWPNLFPGDRHEPPRLVICPLYGCDYVVPAGEEIGRGQLGLVLCCGACGVERALSPRKRRSTRSRTSTSASGMRSGASPRHSRATSSPATISGPEAFVGEPGPNAASVAC